MATTYRKFPQAHCRTCRHTGVIDKYKSSVTAKVDCIKASADCKTTNMVYVIECTKCVIQHVGAAKNALDIQMNGHQSNIKNQLLEKPVAKPFISIGHFLDNLSIFVAEKIRRENSIFRKAKGSYWIQTLQSLTPEGLNLNT